MTLSKNSKNQLLEKIAFEDFVTAHTTTARYLNVASVVLMVVLYFTHSRLANKFREARSPGIHRCFATDIVELY